MKRTTRSRQPGLNAFGQYRRPPDIEKFRECFEQRDGVTVLRGFFDDAASTATWVQHNFHPIELEVHQAMTLGKAARGQKDKPDVRKVKEQFPRLATLATDGDMQEILEKDPRPKDLTATMLARVLHRQESSIKRWAQGKK